MKHQEDKAHSDPDKSREKELWDQLPENAGQPEAFWQAAWDNILRQRRKSAIVRRLKRAAVAAAFSGVLLGAWYWFGAVPRPQQAPAVAEAVYKTIRNTGAEAMELVLDDSTQVSLFPASSLRYEVAFNRHQRDIYLEGTALFNVQQQVSKPFTVIANGIATTVLGTVFKVATEDEKQNTSVYLYQGKVLVKSANPQELQLKKDYYLSPGDVFRYHHNNGTAALEKPAIRLKPAPGKAAHTEEVNVSNWYMFENQGLAQVLDQLSIIWNVPIHYNPDDLKGLNFIGKIERTDTLANVLKDIALLNNLRVVNNGKNYQVKKQ